MIGLPSRRAAVGRTALLGLMMVFGCAKVSPPTQGETGGTGAGAGGHGAGGRTGLGGRTAAGGATGQTDVDAGPCQQASYTFTPKIPSVFVLVDRSGSEFMSATTGIYFDLRTAVLQVMQQLQTQVRFGFAAFVGSHPGGQACTQVYDSVPIDINNADNIATMYNALGPLLPYGTIKAETPAAAVMPMVKSALLGDSGNGQKYMMFVTDSQTDFCDDVNQPCADDAVNYRIQDMYAAGIGTLIIGLPSTTGSGRVLALQSFANAGAGQNIALPSGVPTPTDVYYQCNGSTTWLSMFTALGKPAGTMSGLATYGSPAGTATVYSPTSTSTDALAAQISASLSGVKSCTFDLGNVDGKAISVDTSQLDKAKVLIEGVEVPLDPTNGWSMTTSTQLVLNGTACTTWRDPKNNAIDFQFPCEIIVVP
jgi:hypothetical protein